MNRILNVNKIYSINELTGYAWECAIDNVKKIVGIELTFYAIEKLSIELGIKFNENGDIIK